MKIGTWMANVQSLSGKMRAFSQVLPHAILAGPFEYEQIAARA
jgi:hypothetical protein